MNLKLWNTQLKKLETAVKNKTGTTLRMNSKMLGGNDLPHELLLTTRQKAKLRNAFNNNISNGLKLSKAQISKIIQSGGYLGSLLSKLADPLMKVAIPLAKKFFYFIRNNSSCFSNWCRNSKKNTWFRDHNFNNFKRRNEWHNENRSGFWRKELLKQFKMKQKNKKEDL